MKTVDELIGRAMVLLQMADRCGLEYRYCQGGVHTKKERKEQQRFLRRWLEKNGFMCYMTDTEKKIFDKRIGNPFNKKILNQNLFQSESIEPLLWSLGLTKRLHSYDNYSLVSTEDFIEAHYKLKVHVPNTYEELMKKVSLRREEEIELQDQIAMLWYWRVIEGKKAFKKESVRDILLEIWGDAYKTAIYRALKGKEDFQIYGTPVYKLSSLEFEHLYYRAKWRYHAFEWILTEEDWEDVRLNT